MSIIYSKNNIFEDIDTVFFDKDGTFIDSHIYWGEIIGRRIKAAIEYYEIKSDCYDKLCLSLGYDRASERLVEAGPIALLPREDIIYSLSQSLRDFGVNASEVDITEIFDKVHKDFEAHMLDHVKLLDGAVDLFIRLKSAGLKLAVVTSDTHSNAERTLEHFKIDKYFDMVFGKDDCDEPKRTGKPALTALKQIGSKAENTIAVGDAPMDSDMAKLADLKGSILVATGQIPIEKLKSHSEFCVTSLKELCVK